MEEKEVELMDYIRIIWKRKWIIIIPTFLLVVAVGVYSFLIPQVWEIDAIVMPSKFFVQTVGGQFEEVVFVNPKQIAGQINQRAYDSLISAELNMEINRFPKLKAENLRDTKLIRISIRDEEIEEAKLILFSLFKHIKRDLDSNVDVEMKGIGSQIKSNEIEKLRVGEEIKAFKGKLNIIRQRKNEIKQEMNDIKEKIELLEEEQRLSLKKKNRSETESLAMLLYSNEIQQSIQYHDTLRELLSEKRIEEEDLNLELRRKEGRIKQIANEIDNLDEKRGRIGFTRLIKEPTVSLNPVAPRKKLNVLITGILSLVIFTIFAFFVEYIGKQKAKDKS